MLPNESQTSRHEVHYHKQEAQQHEQVNKDKVDAKQTVRGILAHVFTSEQRRRQGLELPNRLEEMDHPVALSRSSRVHSRGPDL